MEVRSVAVDSESGDLFVGDNRDSQGEPGVVDVFGPDLLVPNVTTEEASDVTATTAVLNGTVDPLSAQTGEGAECEFEYGLTTAYGNRVKCEQPVSSAEAVKSLTVEGLLSGTTYHYRLLAKNSNGGNAGADETFTTKGPGIVAGSESASEVTATSAVLGASVNPDGVETSYRFEYDTSAYVEGGASHGTRLAEGRIPAGSEPVSVSAAATGLSANTLYHYRLVVSSDVEVTPGNTELHEFDGPDRTFTTQGFGALMLPDHRRWEQVSPRDKHGALLLPIDSAASTNGTLIQAATDGHALAYIANAPTEAAPHGNANDVQVLSTRGANGWETRDLTLPHLQATDAAVGPGNEYRFFGEDLSSAVVNPLGAFVACRSATGSAQPCLSEEASEQTAFSSDVGSDAFTPLVTAKAPYADVASGTVFGERGGLEGQFEEPCPPKFYCGPQFVDATADDSHVILTSSVALTPAALAGTRNLYEWTAAAPPSERLRAVSVLPEDEGGGPAPDATLGENNADTRNAIVAGGSRVIWGETSHHLYMRVNATQPQSPVNGNGECTVAGDACTIRLDLPAANFTAVGSPGAVFQFASTNGSRVFFTDSEKLTSDAGAGGGNPDLYECAIVEGAGQPGCSLTDLTPRNALSESADVLGGIPGASEDGSYLYFVADGILENSGTAIAGAVHGTCSNAAVSPGVACNLYVRHNGTTKLVAVLSGADFPDWSGKGSGSDLTGLTARVSPNGGWLAFMSSRSLTGYDNEDVTSRAPGERRDEETYLYDAATGRVSCASCDPSGARPIGEQYATGASSANGGNMPVIGGDELWEASSWLAADVPGWTPYREAKARHQSRYLSNTGRLFFNARDPLVPQAVNNTWDVYEYEPEGLGTCTSSTSTGSTTYKPARTYTTEAEGKQQQGEEGAGCVGLISSGESPEESAFLDASETGGEGPSGEELKQGGGDVFFLTAEKLSKSDSDNSYDVYDAHECTTESTCPPAEAEAPPACTTTDACRAAPGPQPEVFGAPASATFSGPGNVSGCSSSSASLGFGGPTPGSTCAAVAPARPSCSSSLGAPSPKCTRRQNLSKALATCRRKYPHSRKKRNSCEQAARRKYAAKPSSKREKG